MTQENKAMAEILYNESHKHIVDIRTNLFHNKQSPCLNDIPVEFWLGIGRSPSKKGFTPCRVCFVVSSSVICQRKLDEKIDYEKRLIDGNYTVSSNIIARCHSLIHRGYLTKSLVKSHDCIGKKCSGFEKLKPDYWKALELNEAAKRERRSQLKDEKKLLADRDIVICTTLEDSGSIYVTSIREEPRNYLLISYIYDRYIDLSQEVQFLKKELGRNIRLKAVKGSDEAIERLIRKPRRDMGNVTDVRKAPAVGNAAKRRLKTLGIYCLEDLFNRNGDVLYRLDCHKAGKTIDRRYLTAYRSAVEYANNI